MKRKGHKMKLVQGTLLFMWASMFNCENSTTIVQFKLLQYFLCHLQVARVAFYKLCHINLQRNKKRWHLHAINRC